MKFGFHFWLFVPFVLFSGVSNFASGQVVFPDPKTTYLLSNSYLKEDMVLTSGDNGTLQMAKRDSGQKQLWMFKNLGNGYYRITNASLGDGMSIDSDAKAPNIRPTGNYTGQFWKLIPTGNGYYRLSNMYQTNAKSLDTSGNPPHDPFLGGTGNYSGQFWKLTAYDAGQSLTLVSTGTIQNSLPLNSNQQIKPNTTNPSSITLSNTGTPTNDLTIRVPVRGLFGKVGESRATCGMPGQKACGNEPAKLIDNAVGNCPSGSFFDLGSWSCWSCPAGYERSTAEIDNARACRKRDPNARGEFGPAQFMGKLCPDGSFFDPIRDGECWSCPQGYKRSAAHVGAPNACFVPAHDDLVAANKGKRTIWPHECGGGTFWDGWNGGNCWSCPSGYVRTGHPINTGKACSKGITEKQSPATVVKKAVCGPGEIKDMKIKGTQDISAGGGCWACPTAWDRTVFAIDGNTACEKDGGFVFAKATKTQSLSCPADQIFDFVNSKDKRVAAALKARNDELTKGGKPVIKPGDVATCWKCPTGSTRTTAAVYAADACQHSLIKWESATWNHLGLFGLDGAEQVALEVIKSRKSIDTIAADLALQVNKKPADFQKEVWEEIATSPETSSVLNLAVMSRVMNAALKPANATAADKRLANSMAEAIRNFRTFVAQDAIDAYTAWKKADDYGRAEHERRGLASAFYIGPVPPDYEEITASTFLGGLLGGVGLSSLASAALLSNSALQTLFPFGYYHFDDVPAGRLATLVAKRFAAKTATASARASAQIMTKFMGAGPQIVIVVFIEGLTLIIEHVAKQENALPILQTNLATAKQPVDLKRMLATDEGKGEFVRQWIMITSAETMPLSPTLIATSARQALAK